MISSSSIVNAMMRRTLCLCACACALFGGSARAQVAIAEMKLCNANEQHQIDSNHYRLVGNIECESNKEDLRVSADQADYFKDKKQLILTGHVVVVTKDSRVAADKADINTDDRTGTFYSASGTVLISEDKRTQEAALFGTQEPIAYFYGETVQKVSDDKYKITNGAFTTCVQPSPRWQFVSQTAIMRVDKYALMKNMVIKVKDVPLLWLPAMYYPINKEDRATGFLIPIYGTSTLRGQQISNAFFWAINRSSDATFLYDWYSKTGMQYGSEYRYVSDPQSNGTFRFSRLQEHATATTPGRNSFTVRANAVQQLGGGLMARGNVDYFSDVAVQQQYQQDVYSATLRTRTYGGNLSGNWGRDSVSATIDRNEVFYGAQDSTAVGGAPRLTYRRAPTPLFGSSSPLFFTGAAEWVGLTRIDTSAGKPNDYSLNRLDLSPQLQLAITNLPFLTFRAAATYHETRYSRSCVPGTGDFPSCQLSDSNTGSSSSGSSAGSGSGSGPGTGPISGALNRQFVELMGKATGPILTKVWNTPDNGYATKFKHSIEPDVTIQRTSNFANYGRIFKIEGYDYTYGGTTRVTYSITNRFLAQRTDGPPASRTVEFLNIQLQQTYYSNPAASSVDGSYSGAYLNRPPSNFSPIALTVRASPTPSYTGSVRLEYNKQTSTWETIMASGTIKLGSWFQTDDGFTLRKYTNVLDPRLALNTYLSSTTRTSFGGGHYGGLYSFDLNVQDHSFIQQRIGLTYNAQCCGIGFEYQSFNFPNSTYLLVNQDKRFNITFTLAGIGTFSNLLGAFGVGQGANGVYGKGY
jgi:LPS-assembly protein